MIACSGTETKKEEQFIPEIPDFNLHSSWIDSVYNSLSLEEKVAQLFWVETSLSDSITSAFKELPLGVIISNDTKENHFQFKEECDSLSSPLLLGCSDWNWPLSFENHNWLQEQFLSISDSKYLTNLYDSTAQYLNDLGINFMLKEIDSSYISSVNNYPLLSSRNDSILSHLHAKNIATTYLYSSDSITIDSTPFNPQSEESIQIDFNDRIAEEDIPKSSILIKGAVFTNIKDQTDTLLNLIAEEDKIVLIKNLTPKELIGIHHAILHSIELKIITEDVIQKNVRKVLALKEKLTLDKKDATNLHEYDKKHIVSLRSLQYQSKYLSQVLLKNKQNILPLKEWENLDFKWIKIGKEKLKYITPAILNYADISVSITSVNSLALDRYSKSNPIIIVLNEVLDSSNASLLQDKINLYAKSKPIVLVNFKNENLNHLHDVPCLLHSWDDDRNSQSLIAQAIFGGNPISGKLANAIGKHKEGDGITTKKTRLSFSIPEEGGFHRDSLKNVDKVAKEAIYTKVTPGCQVIAARHGKVIYNKSFGYHTYERNLITNSQDVYDIASVTKVAATTICGMKMYDQGLFQISDSLKDHLPDSLTKPSKQRSRLSNITFKELFTHTSGLPSGLPIYKFIAYVDSLIGKFDRYYCDESNSDYCVEVAKNFYLDSAYLDSLWIDMNRIWPGEKKYKYSDANMNMLYQIFRSKIEQSYHEYLAETFYKPLKLRSTTFLPLDYLDTLKHRITPTEYDTYWRYQLLKGSVHDPNAALYGGVAGNAGLFSNANELAVIFQMLMNGGSYGGKQFITPITVKKFSSHQVGSHRGLGFDKPTGQSVSTVAPDCPTTAFGHTGFTGICVWADPENDLLFVFVSNRVHPDPNNKKIITYGTRKRLHQAFYDQLIYTNQYRNKLRSKNASKPEV